MLHHVYEIIFLYHTVNLILVPVPPPNTSSSSDSSLCLSITPSLFYSRLETYLLFFSTNPTARSFTSSSRTAFTDFVRTVSFELLGFCFYFSLFFRFCV